MTRSKKQISVELLRMMDNASPVYRTITELEAPLLELENRAKIMFGVTGDMDETDGMIVYQLACDVRAATEKLSAIYGQLFKMTHPNPAKVAEVEAEAAQREEEAKHARAGVGTPRKAADADLSLTIPAMPNRAGKSG